MIKSRNFTKELEGDLAPGANYDVGHFFPVIPKKLHSVT